MAVQILETVKEQLIQLSDEEIEENFQNKLEIFLCELGIDLARYEQALRTSQRGKTVVMKIAMKKETLKIEIFFKIYSMSLSVHIMMLNILEFSIWVICWFIFKFLNLRWSFTFRKMNLVVSQTTTALVRLMTNISNIPKSFLRFYI